MTHISPNAVQEDWRFRNDDGNETAATWQDAVNVNVDQVLDEIFRLRIQISETAGGDVTVTPSLYVSVNGGPDQLVEGFSEDPANGNPVVFPTSSFVNNDDPTTQQIGTGTGGFVTGRISYVDASTTGATLVGSQTEYEFVLRLDTSRGAVAGDTYAFRVYDNNQLLDAYQPIGQPPDTVPTITAIDIQPPNAPTLGPPADGATLDFTQAQTFEWTFNSPEPGDVQTAFTFERTDPSSVSFTKLTGTPTLPAAGSEVCFSPDGANVAMTHSSSPYLKVSLVSDWSTVAGTPTLGGVPRSAGYEHAGGILAIGTQASPYFEAYDTSNWSLISGTPTLPNWVNTVEFNYADTLIATGHYNSPFLSIFNTSDWSAVAGAPTMTAIVWDLVFSPDDSMLAVAYDASPYLTVFNTSDWSTISGTPTITAVAKAVAFSPDSSKLAVGSQGVSVALQVFDTTNWTEITNMPSVTVPVTELSWSPDGTYIAAGQSSTGFITIVRTSDWVVLDSGPYSNTATGGLDISPDSDLVGVAGGLGDRFFVLERGVTTEYWNGTSWQSTEVSVSSSTESETFPADTW